MLLSVKQFDLSKMHFRINLLYPFWSKSGLRA